MTARAYEWHRVVKRSREAFSSDATDLDFVAEGYTLMKTRFGLMLTDHSTPSFGHEVANQTVFGIIMAQFTPPDPVLNTTDDWIWWESVHTQRTLMTLISPTYSLSQGPLPFGSRESQSRRISPAGGSTIWFRYGMDDPYGDPFTERFYQWDIWAEFLYLAPPA